MIPVRSLSGELSHEGFGKRFKSRCSGDEETQEKRTNTQYPPAPGKGDDRRNAAGLFPIFCFDEDTTGPFLRPVFWVPWCQGHPEYLIRDSPSQGPTPCRHLSPLPLPNFSHGEQLGAPNPEMMTGTGHMSFCGQFPSRACHPGTTSGVPTQTPL
ncbi:hypothetical protein GWK47_017246 [Chionoecetes opilio]|uniref:Uncharacterized protein n=1 Tax=Chionoecetes opilio TaxID=41210 RepID=A0A8J5CJW9_CHIOP|nr:hypothetical protein GWK47_017246 [Chionoecetes opilio]